ncbi:MAG: SMI1/KNR4 family protein [Thermoguttaceae bacterium]|nr:SMI1/KNR4 family protein [Thermoguttaceae bacterium]
MGKYTFEDLRKVIDLNPKLYDNVDCCLYGRVREEDVKNAEQALGVTIPADYRNVLLTWGRIAGMEDDAYLSVVPAKERLEGLTAFIVGNLEKENIVEFTKLLRKESDLPHQYIVVYSAEDWYGCIDASTPEGTLIEWDYFNKCFDHKVNDSFIDSVFDEYIGGYNLLENLLEGPFKWPTSLKEKLIPDFKRLGLELREDLTPDEWY